MHAWGEEARQKEGTERPWKELVLSKGQQDWSVRGTGRKTHDEVRVSPLGISGIFLLLRAMKILTDFWE